MLRIKYVFSVLLFLTIGFCPVSGKEKKVKHRVHTIGDSTMADYVENTTRTRGWGEMLQEFFTEEVQVANYARGGRSSHSFFKEGLWKVVLDSLQAGDYVLIQFAHNDEKEGGKDGADGRGTAPWTTYKRFLEKYVDETRAKGATPILVTPIIRRYFNSAGTITHKGCHNLSKTPNDSTLDYVSVMKHVARNKQVQLIDMTAMTKKFAEQLGAASTIRCIYVPTDGTHTQATGAACYARLAVQGLKEQGILANYIREDIPMVLNPTSLDFGTLFQDEEGVVCFDLTGLNLQPAEGQLIVEAPQGMSISDQPDGVPAASLSYTYTEGKLWNRCFYLHFTPSTSGKIETFLTIKAGGNQRVIPVRAEVKEVKERISNVVSLRNPAIRGLVYTTDGQMTIEQGKWKAEIDEAQKRYVEVIVPGQNEAMLLRQLSFTLEGGIAYRVACAYGKDFYPRTDLGEIQQPNEGLNRLTFPMNVMLKPHQRLHIRLFPWSTREADDLMFRIKDWRVEGSILK